MSDPFVLFAPDSVRLCLASFTLGKPFVNDLHQSPFISCEMQSIVCFGNAVGRAESLNPLRTMDQSELCVHTGYM